MASRSAFFSAGLGASPGLGPLAWRSQCRLSQIAVESGEGQAAPFGELQISGIVNREAMALLGMQRIPPFTSEMKPVHTLIAYVALHRNLESWRRSGVVVGVTVQCSSAGRAKNARSCRTESGPSKPPLSCRIPHVQPREVLGVSLLGESRIELSFRR